MKLPSIAVASAAFALSVLAGATASAQQRPQDLAADDRIVRAVTIDDLRALAEAEGVQVSRVGNYGPVSLDAVTSDGLRFRMIGMACIEGNTVCRGVHFNATYGASADVTAEKVNEISLKLLAVSVWEREGQLGISRYVILDGGQQMANLKANLRNFLGAVPIVTEDVWPSTAQ